MSRRTLVCLAVAALALAAAAVGFSRSPHHAAAGKRILQASSCPAGSANERDADAKGGCLPLNKPESPIESVLMAGARAGRPTPPFATPPPGAPPPPPPP